MFKAQPLLVFTTAQKRLYSIEIFVSFLLSTNGSVCFLRIDRTPPLKLLATYKTLVHCGPLISFVSNLERFLITFDDEKTKEISFDVKD